MNPDRSSPSNHCLKLEVRSWYLIGLTCLIAALLAVGEYFTFTQSVSGEVRSRVGQEKTSVVGVRSQDYGPVLPRN